MNSHENRIAEARRRAALVGRTTVDGLLLDGLADALEAADKETRRLFGIIAEARNFDGEQTVNGITEDGYLSPNEWRLDKIGLILAKADDAPEATK